MAPDMSSELWSSESIASWEEPEVNKPEPPPRREYMTYQYPWSSERFCPINHGDIDVINDSADDEDEDEDYEELIEAMKDASNKAEKSQPRRKFEEPAPTLPSAPADPVVHATLSHRKKCRHHSGGWHGRTIMESEAVEKLKSLIDENVGDLSSIVTDLVAEARQKTLRLITEGEKDAIEVALKAVVEKFRETPHDFKIRYRCVEILDKGMTSEDPVKIEKAEPVLDAKQMEMLEGVLVKIENGLARRRTMSPKGCGQHDELAIGCGMGMF